MTFYPVTSWPHVSVLDPRTGEQLVTWSKVPDANTFCELATEFLTLNPSLEQAANEPAKKKAKVVRINDQYYHIEFKIHDTFCDTHRTKDTLYPWSQESILDADEDDQLAAAIQASLADSQPGGSSSSPAAKKGASNAKCTLVDSDDSEFEPYSGEESNLSTPTPVKQRSKASSRAVSPGEIDSRSQF